MCFRNLHFNGINLILSLQSSNKKTKKKPLGSFLEIPNSLCEVSKASPVYFRCRRPLNVLGLSSQIDNFFSKTSFFLLSEISLMVLTQDPKVPDCGGALLRCGVQRLHSDLARLEIKNVDCSSPTV